MNDFWSSESMAIEDDQGRDALIAARTASVDQWSFLAGASSREDFANRLDLASASLDAAVASVTQSSPDSFLTTRAALADEFAKDFEAIHASRIKDEAEDNLAREAQLRVEAKAKSLADNRRKKTAADFGAPNPPSPQMTKDWGDYASADINVEIDRAQKAYDSAMNAAGRDVSEETIFGYTPEDMKQHVTRRQSSKAASLEDLSADQVLNMARKVLDTESSQNMKGFTLDLVSANMINTVFEKASPEHQKKLLALSGSKFADICFKMAAKGSRKTSGYGADGESFYSDDDIEMANASGGDGYINCPECGTYDSFVNKTKDPAINARKARIAENNGVNPRDLLSCVECSWIMSGVTQEMWGPKAASRKTAENSADVVGYQYKADLYTPQALIELLIQEGVAAPAAAQMDAEDALTQIAEANAIDRFDESSYDSDEFPKVVFSGQSSEDNFVGYEGSKTAAPGQANLPISSDPETVALILDPQTGEVYDEAFGWETAQSMVLNDGYEGVAVSGDGHLSKEELQQLLDSERSRYLDAWGSKKTSSGSGNYEDFDDAAESDAEAKSMVEASLKPSFGSDSFESPACEGCKATSWDGLVDADADTLCSKCVLEIEESV